MSDIFDILEPSVPGPRVCTPPAGANHPPNAAPKARLPPVAPSAGLAPLPRQGGRGASPHAFSRSGQRLKLAGHEASLATALEQLRRIQRHSVRINDSAPIGGVSTIHPEQAALLAALRIKKPPADTQMTLL